MIKIIFLSKIENKKVYWIYFEIKYQPLFNNEQGKFKRDLKVMLQEINVFGIVILFNPDVNVINNIRSYVKHLDKLFIYDNSPVSNQNLFQSLYSKFKVEYIFDGNNDGISKPLNVIAKKLYNTKNSWLLTMDQDSSFSDHSLAKMIDIAKNADENVGILSPFHKTALNNNKSKLVIEKKMTVMTSGNLLNIAAHKKVGGFDEKYFIDCVDWEYCLKLNTMNYQVLTLNDIELNHGLGVPFETTSLIRRKNMVILNHSPIRRYYITRNKLLISSQYKKEYPKRCKRYLYSLIKDLKKIVLYEDKKAIKIIFFIRGVKDFYLKRFGSI